jgi:hypothetical protein
LVAWEGKFWAGPTGRRTKLLVLASYKNRYEYAGLKTKVQLENQKSNKEIKNQ